MKAVRVTSVAKEEMTVELAPTAINLGPMLYVWTDDGGSRSMTRWDMGHPHDRKEVIRFAIGLLNALKGTPE